ncbi:ATP-binding protein [Dietzia cinnamea]|uniref:Histidine kinase/DNA gyrase B/HSP90-like ATPase n=1 Tax=Dietzia cinnamea TaxID=321318 RepID=A0A4R3ZQ94_9ACTN|nr:ATP-binding protein [Dietzia cinnamea]TCW21172.1 histidine kinase/DNA gyrase B/HSP90-like ATPase [Dietzia cinnamea]
MNPGVAIASVTPSAARLTESLRDIGYDFSSAVADLIDNSVSAGAEKIRVFMEFDGEDSRVLICDDGHGMSVNGALESLRFGSRRDYELGDLGRYGLGLKTASLSQGRSVTVVSRTARMKEPQIQRLDLDLIAERDDWIVVVPHPDAATTRARELLAGEPGTVVIWEKLDRILPARQATGGWAKRRFDSLREKLISHLSMVFHRFLAGEGTARKIEIWVDDQPLAPWDPFQRDEPELKELGAESFEVMVGDHAGKVHLRRFILPSRNAFSSPEAFEAASGPLKWNRQQGLYIYRANRLVQWGGWAGTRALDEHTKLARASVDFDTDLDAAFNINVAKMRVALPPQLKQMLGRPISELCILANNAYRVDAPRRRNNGAVGMPSEVSNGAEIGLAIKAALVRTGNFDALKQISDLLKKESPEMAKSLGF